MTFSKKFKDYLKCVYANKFTFAGYLISIASICDSTNTISNIHSSQSPDISLLKHRTIDFLVLYGGITMMAFTSCGQETYDHYIKAREQIKLYGKIDPRYLEKIRKTYCRKVGIKLALKEANLENRLI
jgi:hypothetical protein